MYWTYYVIPYQMCIVAYVESRPLNRTQRKSRARPGRRERLALRQATLALLSRNATITVFATTTTPTAVVVPSPNPPLLLSTAVPPPGPAQPVEDDWDQDVICDLFADLAPAPIRRTNYTLRQLLTPIVVQPDYCTD
jgi:hypothetical protein